MVGLHHFGGKLNAGSAAADNHNIQAFVCRISGFGKQVEQVGVEVLRILCVFQYISVFAAGRAEEIGTTTQRQHAAVKADKALGNDHFAVFVVNRLQAEGFVFGLEFYQFAEYEAEMVGARQNAVREAFLLGVEGAGGHFVQGGFPNMKGRAVDEQHFFRAVFAPECTAEFGGQFQTAGAAADNHGIVIHGDVLSFDV